MEAPDDLGLHEVLEAAYDAWFTKLQALTDVPLVPEDWVGRWYDYYTPEDALAAGPEGEDDWL